MVELVITGRAVQGDPYKMQPKKDNQNKTVIDQATGQPMMQYFLAVAVQKGDPKWPAVKAAIDSDALRFWPGGETRRSDFAWKIGDGDSTAVNKANKRNVDYDGFPGCWILKFGTLYPPKVQIWDSVQRKWVDSPGGHVKLGDYISVAFEVTSNKSLQTPGLHLNPKLVGFESAGDPIVGANGPDGNDVFGARGAPGESAHAASAAAGAATGQTSGTASHGDYRGYMGTDTPPPPGDAPPPPSGPVMTDKAGGKPYQSFIDKGWTDEQLRAHGYLA